MDERQLDVVKSTLQRLHDDGDVAGVLDVLREHAAVAELQCFGLASVSEMIPGPTPDRLSTRAAAAMNAGALQVALAALQAHGALAIVVTVACCVLGQLSAFFSAEVGASGAIEAAVAGMRRHVEDPGVQECAARLLYALAREKKNADARGAHSERMVSRNRRRAGEAGAVGALLAAMRKHSGTKTLLKLGFDALFELIEHAAVCENARRAHSQGAVDVCVAALRANLREPDVAGLSTVAFVFFSVLRTSADAAAMRAGELGAVEVYVELLRRLLALAASENVVSRAAAVCCPLRALIIGHAPNVQRAWRAGALPVMRALVAPQCPLRQRLQQFLDPVIAALQDFEAVAEAAAAAAAAELLAGEETAAQSQPQSRPQRSRRARAKRSATKRRRALRRRTRRQQPTRLLSLLLICGLVATMKGRRKALRFRAMRLRRFRRRQRHRASPRRRLRL